MPLLPVRLPHLRQRLARMPVLPARPRPVLFRSDRDLGGGFANPSPDGGTEEFRDFPQPVLKLSNPPPTAWPSSATASASSWRSDTTSAASTSDDGDS